MRGATRKKVDPGAPKGGREAEPDRSFGSKPFGGLDQVQELGTVAAGVEGPGCRGQRTHLGEAGIGLVLRIANFVMSMRAFIVNRQLKNERRVFVTVLV